MPLVAWIALGIVATLGAVWLFARRQSPPRPPLFVPAGVSVASVPRSELIARMRSSVATAVFERESGAVLALALLGGTSRDELDARIAAIVTNPRIENAGSDQFGDGVWALFVGEAATGAVQIMLRVPSVGPSSNRLLIEVSPYTEERD